MKNNKKDWTRFVKIAVNNSIGNEHLHFSEEEVVLLFKKEEFGDRQMYALRVIFSEIPLQALYNFFLENGIDLDEIEKRYDLVRKSGIVNEKIEWFLGKREKRKIA